VRATATIKSSDGLTFVELMVTVVVMAIGIVMVYRGLLTALDFQKNTMIRAYAMNLLEDKLHAAQFAYQQEEKIPVYEGGEIDNIVLNNQPMRFHFTMEHRPLPALADIQEVTLTLSWQGIKRRQQIQKHAYISRF